MKQPDIEQVLSAIRAIRAQEWKRAYKTKYDETAPEPTDKDLGFPLETLSVHWGTGYLLVDLNALAKMPAAVRNKIYKLGGLSK